MSMTLLDSLLVASICNVGTDLPSIGTVALEAHDNEVVTVFLENLDPYLCLRIRMDMVLPGEYSVFEIEDFYFVSDYEGAVVFKWKDD